MSLPCILHSQLVQLLSSLLQSHNASPGYGDPSRGIVSRAGKWKGTTVAVKILEHSAESSSGLKELRESVLSSSIIHPNVVSTYKIRTLPTAARKPLPQVQPGRCIYASCLASPLTLRLSQAAVHSLTAAVLDCRPPPRTIMMGSHSPISSHVII